MSREKYCLNGQVMCMGRLFEELCNVIFNGVQVLSIMVVRVKHVTVGENKTFCPCYSGQWQE